MEEAGAAHARRHAVDEVERAALLSQAAARPMRWRLLCGAGPFIGAHASVRRAALRYLHHHRPIASQKP